MVPFWTSSLKGIGTWLPHHVNSNRSPAQTFNCVKCRQQNHTKF